MFWLLGSVLMGSDPAQKILRTKKNAWWFIPANIAFVLGAPAIGLLLAAVAAPGIFGIGGLLGLLAGSVVLNVVCAITHDYASNDR